MEVVHAWHLPYVGGYPYTAGSFDPTPFEDAARQTLDSVVDGMDATGLPAPLERILHLGDPATGVLETAKGADLVVVGSRGLGRVQRARCSAPSATTWPTTPRARWSSSRPGTDAMPSAAPGLAETHSAIVFFVGDRAYKVKKPVDLGFLDFRTVEARRAACHREVELNRRLAPDVYLGVADVHGVDGSVCDHLVVMRRMPAERRLSTLVADGADVEGELWDLAHLLAAFHARAERSAAADDAASIARDAGPMADEHRGDAPPGRLRARRRAGRARRRRSPTPTSTAGRASSRRASPTDGRSTATVTCSPTTSSAWTTAPGSSTASSSTTGSGWATGSPTPPSSPWTSSDSAGPTSGSGSSTTTPSTAATPGRRRWPTTTWPTAPRSGPR